MLCPQANLPSPQTVSRDVLAMYSFGAQCCTRLLLGLYFLFIGTLIHADVMQKHNGAIHLVMDGWTSPILACYLGIVVVWFCHGRIHRCILEFARYEAQLLSSLPA